MGVLLVMTCLTSIICYGQKNSKETGSEALQSFLIPAIIAAFGYLFKSIYDIILEREKRKRSLLEESLKIFYWPILTRLEENSAIYLLMLGKENRTGDLKRNIANFVEDNVILKNHQEIMVILTNNRYLAKFDEELSGLIGLYIKHAVIYISIHASQANLFPADLEAEYPIKFNDAIKDRTEKLQRLLDKKAI
jgi:hypothetical protein